MSNLSVFPTTTTASTVTKIEATEIARRLYADDANAFSVVSNTAARESFCKRCASLAISAMVHGDDSRLRRLKTKAIELPEYRKSKSGEIMGNLGKLLLAYTEASNIGFMIREHMKQNGIDTTKVDLWDLSIIESSPSFGALIAPPKTRIKETTSTSTTSTSTTTAPSTSTSTTTAPTTKPEKHWSECAGKIGDADDALLETAANAAQDKVNAAAAAAAEELVRNAVLAAERLRATGKSTAEKIAAFCDLATQLGIKLTASQLKALDVIEAKAKAVA